MKNYPIVCPSCQGSGYIAVNCENSTSSTGQVCPACYGSKIVICTEE